MKYKTKKTLKTLALSVLGIGALVGVASGINTLVEKQDTELKTIIPIFEVGGLKTEDGKYEETDGSIYTKQAFECQGLEIKLDFDNTIKYQVFYYEDDGDFISSTDVLLGNQELSVPFGATHARLEITPNWAEMGEDYKKTEDQMIKWYEVAKYSTQLDVKVNKDQSSIAKMIYSGEIEDYLCDYEYMGFGTGGLYEDGRFVVSTENGVGSEHFAVNIDEDSQTLVFRVSKDTLDKKWELSGSQYASVTIMTQTNGNLFDGNNYVLDGNYAYIVADVTNENIVDCTAYLGDTSNVKIYML